MHSNIFKQKADKIVKRRWDGILNDDQTQMEKIESINTSKVHSRFFFMGSTLHSVMLVLIYMLFSVWWASQWNATQNPFCRLHAEFKISFKECGLNKSEILQSLYFSLICFWRAVFCSRTLSNISVNTRKTKKIYTSVSNPVPESTFLNSC